jgi:hypothetical protein
MRWRDFLRKMASSRNESVMPARAQFECAAILWSEQHQLDWGLVALGGTALGACVDFTEQTNIISQI